VLRSDEAEHRTADKYSNANDGVRFRPTAANQRPAPTTASDLDAESSHRGVTGRTDTQDLDPAYGPTSYRPAAHSGG
jgi:hypothetical protein